MSENTRQDICLRCPRGCEVTTVLDTDGGIVDISGNQCKLGIEYVKQEITDPRRVLPTLVRVSHGARPMVPVWTPEPVPKKLLLELAAEARLIDVEAPVAVGDVLLENWRGLGIQLVASGAVERDTNGGT